MNVGRSDHDADRGLDDRAQVLTEREVRCGCIRYGGCWLKVHSSSENSARTC